ncbi:response regulator [Hymenobacter sediminicola]|uniref:Response regulator n=1 Tax=Hymenobacter sediminicola TaxID=2761579 RepID=A0A7G7W6C6_9BACT|nr:response regulator [Hymenobacter sediminicola]QNH61919.1 response regulator [Hymenobacter sediminicola]
MQKLPCLLLVDDDQATNFLNRRLLEKLQVSDQLLVALNGQEALDVLVANCQENTPQCPVLLFLDVKMPVMNGFDFLEAYQQLPLHKELVIIVMLTTSLHPQDMHRLEQFPIAGLLSKPLTKDKVNQVLKTHFQRELPAD